MKRYAKCFRSIDVAQSGNSFSDDGHMMMSAIKVYGPERRRKICPKHVCVGALPTFVDNEMKSAIRFDFICLSPNLS